MLAVKSVNVRDHFREWCDKISKGETVVVSRPRNENIYMINETEYNAFQKAKRNAEYPAAHQKSDEERIADKAQTKRKHGQKVLTLASQSPRRRELLSRLGIVFRVAPSTVEERITKTAPDEVVRELSFQKAEDVASREPEGIWVLGADTVVALDGEILGKPADAEDARAMLRQLSGRIHSVFTGVTLYRRMAGKIEAECFSEETRVEFYPMTEEEIDGYVASGDPMDKAGAYGIQGPAAAFIRSIEGDYNNVVGLPVAAVYQRWKERFQYGD